MDFSRWLVLASLFVPACSGASETTVSGSSDDTDDGPEASTESGSGTNDPIDAMSTGQATSGSSSVGSAATTDVEDTFDSTTTEGPGDPGTTEGSSSSGGVPVVCGDGAPDNNGACFGEATQFPTSSSPASVATGDFDGDGMADIAVANFATDQVTALYGDGAGGLSEPSSTSLGDGAAPVAIAAGDLTSDGISDVLVANSGLASVSILAGSAGGFSVTEVSIGGAPSDVAIAELNGDGMLDFAVVNTEDDVFSTWVSTGAGGYWLADVNSGGPIPFVDAFALGDVAIAGAVDVVFSGDLVVGASPGVGDGSIDETVVVVAEVPAPILRIQGGDANDDGELDVVLATTGGVAVLVGDGDPKEPTFTELWLGEHEMVVDVRLVDVTGEGNADAIAVARGDAQVVVYPGHGDGTFGSPTTLAVGPGATGLEAVDLDGDGIRDLVVTDDSTDALWVFPSNP